MKFTTSLVLVFSAVLTVACGAQAGSPVLTNPQADQVIQQPVGTKLQVNGTMWVGQYTGGTAMIDAFNSLAFFGDNAATNGLSVSQFGNVGIGTPSFAANSELSIVDSAYQNEVGEHIQNVDPSGFSVIRMGTDSTAAVGFALHQFNSGFPTDPESAVAPASTALVAFDANGMALSTYVAAPIRFFTGGTDSTDERMRVNSSGNVGIGTSTPGTKLEVAGNVTISGAGAGLYFSTSTTPQTTPWTGSLGGQDYADSVDVTGTTSKYEAGDVLSIQADKPGSFAKATGAYSTLVAGVYSTKPGLVGRKKADVVNNTTEVPMALVGMVPAKVTTENGPIKVGDLLVVSSTPGYAMKGTDRSRLAGAIVGKALENLPSGSGRIMVLVTLQ